MAGSMSRVNDLSCSAALQCVDTGDISANVFSCPFYAILTEQIHSYMNQYRFS